MILTLFIIMNSGVLIIVIEKFPLSLSPNISIRIFSFVTDISVIEVSLKTHIGAFLIGSNF